MDDTKIPEEQIEAVASVIYNMGAKSLFLPHAIETLKESVEIWLSQAYAAGAREERERIRIASQFEPPEVHKGVIRMLEAITPKEKE